MLHPGSEALPRDKIMQIAGVTLLCTFLLPDGSVPEKFDDRKLLCVHDVADAGVFLYRIVVVVVVVVTYCLRGSKRGISTFLIESTTMTFFCVCTTGAGVRDMP